MTIYPGALEEQDIKAQVLGENGEVLYTLDVEVGTATLTVRGTTNSELIVPVGNDTSSVTGNADIIDQETGCTITAVAPADTQYYINESLVSVDPANVSLLSDDVVETDPLYDYIVENDLADSNSNYLYRYLDLVDDTNGRAWVTATNPIEVYWKIPDGASRNGTFQIIHFQGLDREYDDLDVQLATNKPVVYSTQDDSLEVVRVDGEWYLKFSTDSFSPFVLVWEETGSTPSRPGGTPSVDRPTKPDREEPENLNTEDHISYIIGYPEDYRTGQPTDDESLWPVKPEGNITRAEVATIFFRLLTDEAREEYWSQTNPYSDVTIDKWYNNAISTLSNMGILDGYADGTFLPDNAITRAKFVKIAVSFFEYADRDFTYAGQYSDVDNGQ